MCTEAGHAQLDHAITIGRMKVGGYAVARFLPYSGAASPTDPKEIMSLTLLALVLIAIILINLTARITSRKGSSPVHRTAFWAGTLGLMTSLVVAAGIPTVAVWGLAGGRMEGLEVIVVTAAVIAVLSTVTATGCIVGMLARKKSVHA